VHRLNLFAKFSVTERTADRSQRSSQSNLLSVQSQKHNFGTRSFRVAAPTVWNSLPADICACTLYGSFIRQLKSFYFNNAI